VIEWFALVELDVVRGGLGDRVIRVDLDAGLLEQVAQPAGLPDRCRGRSPRALRRVDLDRRAVIVAELRDFAGGLDAGRPAPPMTTCAGSPRVASWLASVTASLISRASSRLFSVGECSSRPGMP